MDMNGNDNREPDCKERILSNDYAEYIVSFNYETGIRNYFPGECITVLDEQLAIVTLNRKDVDFMYVITQLYYMVPKCYGLMDTTSMEESGILKAQNQPILNLKGRNILVGIIDTGIDYQNPLFRQADGTTRIKSIWDQTIQTGTPPDGIDYGTEYTEDMINQALQSENPLEQVPSVDTNGHGTFVSGIIAGGEDEAGRFIGAAPMADILVVKLKQAKQYLKDFYFIDSDEVFQETDIMMAIYYLRRQALKRNQPISIYLGVGTNSGDHVGQGTLNQYMNRVNIAPGELISIPAGNEGNARHHFSGTVTNDMEYETVELNVGANEPGFVMELWGRAPNTYAIGIESPYGEVIRQIAPRFQNRQRYAFLLERTVVEVAYVLVEELSGEPLIFVRMEAPTEGIWRFRVYATGSPENRYNIWLPIREFISEDTYFLHPDPEVTLTEPATAEGPICSTAYNHVTDSLYIEASRGYTGDGEVKPDLAAPGVNVYGPDIRTGPEQVYGYTRRSGTSIAAAHTAGAAALLMEWVESRSNINRMSGVQMKRYLIRGADRRPDMSYPNPAWGYGTLNLFGTFEGLRQRDSI